MRVVVVLVVAVVVACAGVAHGEADDRVTIVMSTGNGLWNTGVWAGFGEGPYVELKWAGSGIVVNKTECQTPVPCAITHDQSQVPVADAVVMETVNHPKFLMDRARGTPFPFPDQHVDPRGVRKPLLGMFYYEPYVWYPDYTVDAQLRSRFDFTMEPTTQCNIPLSMTCSWGRPVTAFLSPPPAKDPATNLIAYFSDGGLDPYYENWVWGLSVELGADLHAFGKFRNADLPPSVSTTADRVRFMERFSFVLVTEQVALDNWVSPEFSQALVAGAVPVYVGAPNIEEYAPGEGSFVHIRDWITRHPRELADYLRAVAADPHSYQRLFEWKKGGLAPSFQQKLDTCVYHAECRLCALVANALGKTGRSG